MTDDRRLWQRARTLADLGQLTAQWLEGTISYHPSYGAPEPHAETHDLVPALARANRAGYVTTNSQPGQPLTGGSGQRAYVSGFCTEQLADKIRAAILGTDLIALVTPAGWENYIQIPVTIDDGAEFTWVGGTYDEANIEHFYAQDCPSALPALLAAWQVEVLDPAWGRNDLLWAALDRAWA